MLLKRKIKYTLLICLFISITLILSSCGNKYGLSEGDDMNQAIDESSLDEIENSMIMPEDLGSTEDLKKFATLDLYGETVDNGIFSDYKYTVIDVWGTYCTPCIKAMPELKKLYDEYKEKGVNVVGIVIDVQNADRTVSAENVLKARQIVEKQEADFTHILVPKGLLYSFLKDVQVIPTQFLVDSEGNIVSDYYKGGKRYEQWCDILDKKL